MVSYALSVAIILAGCFVFYKILLQKETFFPLNRFVLITCLVLSFSLPLVPVPAQWSFRKSNVALMANTTLSIATSKVQTPAGNTGNITLSKENETFFKDISVIKIVLWAYWLGVIIFGINFLVQLFILFYRVYSRPFIQDGKFRIVEITGDQAPCSFANSIFINPEKYDWDTYTQIILHEKIHIQQGHSYDIIFAELALVFQWFNPFAWLYRKAMEDNLEFLTDNELLQHSDIEPTSYQMSLVKVSAPNFPASLTTNYNQSILKKRLIMMNAKKSSINATWKYLCIVPLLLVFIALLNKPIAYGKSQNPAAKNKSNYISMSNKGTWFATIKKDKIDIRFEDDDNDNSSNSNDFELADFKNLPREAKGDFTLSREAGTMLFNGKFDGNAGMGTYSFESDKNFFTFLNQEGVDIENKDGIVFFFVNLKKDFVKMLKAQGFTQISKNDLIPLAALKVTSAYVASLKNAGIEVQKLSDLIPLKALNVDAAYIAEIKKSGYQHLTAQKLITLKAQGIDGEFIKNAKNINEKVKSSREENSEVISKVQNHRTESKTTDESDEDSAIGLLIAKKALNVSPGYAKSFSSTKLKVADDELLAFKALGITADYVKGFEALGLTLGSESYCGMKALGLTAAEYNEYKKLGFNKLSVDDVLGAKATGTTPTFISAMKKKGHNYSSIEKYVSMKVIAIGED